MQLDTTKIIDRYLSGELSASDHAAFEERLKNKKSFKKKLNYIKHSGSGDSCIVKSRCSTRRETVQTQSNYQMGSRRTRSSGGNHLYINLVLINSSEKRRNKRSSDNRTILDGRAQSKC